MKPIFTLTSAALSEKRRLIRQVRAVTQPLNNIHFANSLKSCRGLSITYYKCM